MKNTALHIAAFVIAAGFVLPRMALAEDGRSAKAVAELTRGVSEIDSDGLPGPVICISENAFPIGVGRHWSGCSSAAAAGAFYGSGRVVYLGHPNYLTGKPLADTDAFLSNAVKWLADGKSAPKVAALRGKRIADRLSKLGFDVREVQTAAEIGGCDVVATTDFRASEAAAIQGFVRNGGGLLGAGLGWGWKQITIRTSKNTSLSHDFGDNLVLGPMGIVMGSRGTPRPDGFDHYPMKPALPGTHLLDALAILGGADEPTAATEKRCVMTVTQALEAVPKAALSLVTDRYPKFAEVQGEYEKSLAGGGEMDDASACMLAAKAAGLVIRFAAEPPEPLYADESAEDAPGSLNGLYIGVSLVGTSAKVEEYESREAIPGGEGDIRWKTDWLLMRRVEPTNGPVVLGAPDNPGARREVELTRPYYIGIYEITQSQWQRIMGERLACAYSSSECWAVRPQCGVSYDAARGTEVEGANWPEKGAGVGESSLVGRLRAKVDGRILFDLPSEAEWEVAARGGSTNRWNNGSGSAPRKAEGYAHGGDSNLDRLGRYCQNGGEMPKGKAAPDDCGPELGTAPVGSYEPNALGLYDMHGNVYEHCRDWLEGNVKTPGLSGRNPAGPTGIGADGKKRERRVQKGGSYWNFLYGGPGAASPGSRNFGGLCAPSTGHGATGLRVMAPAQMWRAPHPPAGSFDMGPDASQARAEILRGVDFVLSEGFPSPLACIGDKAFPLVAGKDQEGHQLIAAAAAMIGKGRVVLYGEESILDEGSPSAFRDGALRWLGEDGREVRKCDFAGMTDEQCAEMAEFVSDGGSLFAACCLWKWRAAVEEETGMIPPISDFPANSALIPLGLAVLDGGALHTAQGGYTVRASFRRGVTVPDARRLRAKGFYADVAEASQVKNTLRSLREVLDPFMRSVKELPAKGYAAAEWRRQKAYPGLENGFRVRSGDGIVFLGDSITRLGGEEGGWIDMVLSGLAEGGVTNVMAVRAGWDGQTSGDMLGRIDSLLNRPGVNWICISCGVNDVWGFDWKRGVMLSDYRRNVRRMLDKAAERGVNVVLLTPTLVGENTSFARNRILMPYVEFIRAEAKRRGLLLADVNRAEVEGLSNFHGDGLRHFTYDGVHPVKAGHEMFAKTVLDALRR